MPANKDWGCLGWGLLISAALFSSYLLIGILIKFGILPGSDLFGDTLIWARRIGRLIVALWDKIFNS